MPTLAGLRPCVCHVEVMVVFSTRCTHQVWDIMQMREGAKHGGHQGLIHAIIALGDMAITASQVPQVYALFFSFLCVCVCVCVCVCLCVCLSCSWVPYERSRLWCLMSASHKNRKSWPSANPHAHDLHMSLHLPAYVAFITPCVLHNCSASLSVCPSAWRDSTWLSLDA